MECLVESRSSGHWTVTVILLYVPGVRSNVLTPSGRGRVEGFQGRVEGESEGRVGRCDLKDGGPGC